MELEKKEAEILEKAIHQWQQQQLLTADKARELRNTIRLKRARVQIAQYFFIIAIASSLLAFAAIFIDDKLLEKIKSYFNIGNMVIAVACTLVALGWLMYLYKKRNHFNSLIFEVYAVLGGMVTLSAMVYYCKDIGLGPQYTGLLLASAIVLLLISLALQSRALWLGGILAVMGWYGSFAQLQQNEHNLFMGMNYPVRFTLFGLLVTAMGFVQAKVKPLSFSYRQTYIMGLLIFFTGMWGVSVFGNYGHYEQWLAVRQVQVIGYSVVLAIASVLALVLGIKYRDDATRDFGIIFILLNLYTRYFEFFWNSTNKGLFFLLLAVSFAVVGWQLEKRFTKRKTIGNNTRTAI